MSESLVHESMPRQMADLATLGGYDCVSFKHQLFDSSVQFPGTVGNTTKDIFNFTVTKEGGLIITSFDIKVLFDTTDTTLVPAGQAVPDLRSTDDLNPYGPFAAGSGGVGTFNLLVNGKSVFPPAFNDLTIMGPKLLLVFLGGDLIQLQATPNQPANKKLQLVTVANCFSCSHKVASELKKNQTEIITLSALS